MNQRSQLGKVYGDLLRTAEGYANDAISEHYGVWPEPNFERIAQRHGWTMKEIDAELTRRGISEKWIYHNGIQ